MKVPDDQAVVTITSEDGTKSVSLNIEVIYAMALVRQSVLEINNLNYLYERGLNPHTARPVPDCLH